MRVNPAPRARSGLSVVTVAPIRSLSPTAPGTVLGAEFSPFPPAASGAVLGAEFSPFLLQRQALSLVLNSPLSRSTRAASRQALSLVLRSPP